MTNRKLGQILTHLRAVAAGGNGGVSDAQLLDRFFAGRDEAAFELLVRRHERLVFGVCRRVLGQAHDAEDAFQATFLVLARKAASIAHGGAVASWLYKVAYRVALAARTERTRRGRREKSLDAAADVAAATEATCLVERADLCALLDEELSRMPERFRTVAVLCYLEGMTVEEAAQQLGCPRGTVASRLARARARLRDGLTRRGLAVSAGLAAVTLAQARAVARPPESLIPATVQAAKHYGSATAASAGAISPRVAALTEGALRAMSLMKLKLSAAAAVFVAVLLAAGWAAGTMRASAGGEPAASASAPRAGNEAPKPQKKDAPATDLARLQGDWELVRTVRQGKTSMRKVGLVWRIRGTTIFPVNPQAGQGSTTSSSPSGSSTSSGTLVNHLSGQGGKRYFHLNAQASPKAIDLVRGQASGGISTEFAIYQFNGDALTLCIGRAKGERPREFRAAADELFPTLSMFRRLKETDIKVKASAWDPVAALRQINHDFSPRGALVRLQGAWSLAKMKTVGELASAQDAGETWKITGATVHRLLKGKQVTEALVSVGVSDGQKTLDLFQGHADGSITVQRGIYQFEGDKLKVCLHAPDRPRPRDFAWAADGSFPAVYVCRREADAGLGAAPLQVRIFALRHAKAQEAGRMLQNLYREQDAKRFNLAVDERTNAVVVRALPKLMEEVEAVLSRLDKE